MKTFWKDPDAVLDFEFDWAALTNGTGSADWLESGETISTRTVTEDSGITVDSDAIVNSATGVVVWLSGGTAGNSYKVTCHITTSSGREDDRTILVMCMER